MLGLAHVGMNDLEAALSRSALLVLHRYLVIKRSWPSGMRTLSGDHARFEATYFNLYPGCAALAKGVTGVDGSLRPACPEAAYCIESHGADVTTVCSSVPALTCAASEDVRQGLCYPLCLRATAVSTPGFECGLRRGFVCPGTISPATAAGATRTATTG